MKINFEKRINKYELANSMIRFFGFLFWASFITLLDIKANFFYSIQSGLISWMFDKVHSYSSLLRILSILTQKLALIKKF